jgi:hypothetical protein
LWYLDNLLYICMTWSWRIYDCSIYVLYKSGVTFTTPSRCQSFAGARSPSFYSSPVGSCRRRALTSAPPPSNPTIPIASPPPAAAIRLELGHPPCREAPHRRAPLRRCLGRRGNLTSGHPLFLPSPPMDAPWAPGARRLALLHSQRRPSPEFGRQRLCPFLPRRAKGIFVMISKVLRV